MNVFRSKVEHVILGVINNHMDDQGEGEKYQIERFDVHPERDQDVIGVNDIAVITLKENITFSRVKSENFKFG